MRNVLAIALAILADAVRRKVVYVVFALAALMAIAIPGLPSYGVGVVGSVFREVAIALTYVGALVLALALAANRIPGEIERRTVYNVLSKDVRRWEYLAGTWLGIWVVVGAAICMFTVVDQVIAFLQYGDPMFVLWEGSLGVLLEMGALIAFAVAVSTRTGPVVVAVASGAFLFAVHSRSSLAAEGTLVWRLFPSFDSFNVINPVAHGDGVSAGQVAVMTAAFVAWVVGLLAVGHIAFRERDL